MSALENLGAHLLGRNPHEPDDRDFRLERVIETGVVNPIDLALDAVNHSRAAAAVKAYLNLVNPQLDKVTPTPAPSPTPPVPPGPSGAVTWADTDQVLDQGNTPRCCGFGEAQWGNTLPIDDHEQNADGDANYQRLKIIDGEPGAEDGSTVHTVAKDLVSQGKVKTYAWASTTAAMSAWVLKSGPLIVGFDWYQDQFTPDQNGFVTPTGGIAGGHCFVCIGYDPSSSVFEFLNSWGSGWSLNGRFYMHEPDVAMLLGSSGAECMAAVEI